MRALTVCVEYDDLLAITLARNRQHFEDFVVVTARWDMKTPTVAREHGAGIYYTDAFRRNGASFNKGLAIEEALDSMGRYGWLCVVDADILLPKRLKLGVLEPMRLYCPARRVLEDARQWEAWADSGSWDKLPLAPDGEFGGYFHLFHANDPHLGKPPWYGVNWRHAGGYDSDFIKRWLPDFNTMHRPKEAGGLSFEVLHLGPLGENWFGRYTDRLDGQRVADAPHRKARMQQMRRDRAQFGFAKEKL